MISMKLVIKDYPLFHWGFEKYDILEYIFHSYQKPLPYHFATLHPSIFISFHFPVQVESVSKGDFKGDFFEFSFWKPSTGHTVHILEGIPKPIAYY